MSRSNWRAAADRDQTGTAGLTRALLRPFVFPLFRRTQLRPSSGDDSAGDGFDSAVLFAAGAVGADAFVLVVVNGAGADRFHFQPVPAGADAGADQRDRLADDRLFRQVDE